MVVLEIRTQHFWGFSLYHPLNGGKWSFFNAPTMVENQTFGTAVTKRFFIPTVGLFELCYPAHHTRVFLTSVFMQIQRVAKVHRTNKTVENCLTIVVAE
jgi:hypothetical protein